MLLIACRRSQGWGWVTREREEYGEYGEYEEYGACLALEMRGYEDLSSRPTRPLSPYSSQLPRRVRARGDVDASVERKEEGRRAGRTQMMRSMRRKSGSNDAASSGSMFNSDGNCGGLAAVTIPSAGWFSTNQPLE